MPNEMSKKDAEIYCVTKWNEGVRDQLLLAKATGKSLRTVQRYLGNLKKKARRKTKQKNFVKKDVIIDEMTPNDNMQLNLEMQTSKFTDFESVSERLLEQYLLELVKTKELDIRIAGGLKDFLDKKKMLTQKGTEVDNFDINKLRVDEPCADSTE